MKENANSMRPKQVQELLGSIVKQFNRDYVGKIFGQNLIENSGRLKKLLTRAFSPMRQIATGIELHPAGEFNVREKFSDENIFSSVDKKIFTDFDNIIPEVSGYTACNVWLAIQDMSPEEIYETFLIRYREPIATLETAYRIAIELFPIQGRLYSYTFESNFLFFIKNKNSDIVPVVFCVDALGQDKANGPLYYSVWLPKQKSVYNFFMKPVWSTVIKEKDF